jgi:putative nucleotidyltransferase with HDIG domain
VTSFTTAQNESRTARHPLPIPSIEVLLVEDNPGDARLIRELFRDVKARHFNLTHTDRLSTAVQRVVEGGIDAILLDLSLPDSQGLDTLATMYPHTPAVPILVLTGLDDEAVGLEAVQQGAQDYLVKGQIDGQLLARAILYAIERKQVEGALRDREEHIQTQVEQLAALRSIDIAITSSQDLRHTLDVLLEQVVAQLHVDAADVLLLNPHAQTLERAAARGFDTNYLARSSIRLGEGYAGRAALEGRIFCLPDMSNAQGISVLRPPRLPLLTGELFISYYAVPLITKGQVQGVLEVFHRSLLEPDAKWLVFLEALAGQAAIAIDNASLFNELHRSNTELALAYDTTLEGWSRALDLRDKETEGHTKRVTELTIKLARRMGVSEAELVHMRRGALLHDIGKMGIPDDILLKPGPLSDEEWVIMRRHPVYAYDLLSPIAFLRPALDIPHYHHEKWDGTGYPHSLKGEQIPFAARIFAIVDVWDALCSDRPYRAARPVAKVREHILSLSGSHFDPWVVEAFVEMAL